MLNEASEPHLSSRPFVIDLESTNGTMVNNEQIPVSRYYELKASDGELASRTVGIHLIPFFSSQVRAVHT